MLGSVLFEVGGRGLEVTDYVCTVFFGERVGGVVRVDHMHE